MRRTAITRSPPRSPSKPCKSYEPTTACARSSRRRCFGSESAARKRRGNFAAAWELEHGSARLGSKAARRPASARRSSTRSATNEWISSRLSRRRDSAAGHPRLLLPGAASAAEPAPQGDSGNCTSGQKDVAAGAILMEAQMLYLQAIRVFLRQKAYSSDELRELETKLIRSSYAYGGSYQVGRRKPGAARFVRRRQRAPLSQRIDALIQIADWDLLFDQRPLALELYEDIHAFLKQRGVAQASIDELFSPETPHMLPTFAARPRGRGPRANRDRLRRHRLRDHALRNEPPRRRRELEQRVEGCARRPRSPRLPKSFPTDREGWRVRARGPGRRALLRRGVAPHLRSTTRMPRGPCCPRSFRNSLRRHGAARHGRDEPAARHRDRRRDAAPRRQRRRRRDRRERRARAYGADELRHRRRSVRHRLGRGAANACTA